MTCDLTEFYDGGYLSVKGLEIIENWPIEESDTLLDSIKPVWMHSDCGCWHKYQERKLYRIATGGWSGNEDIIEALSKTQDGIWWHMWWIMSKRGGLYIFQDPEEYRKKWTRGKK